LASQQDGTKCVVESAAAAAVASAAIRHGFGAVGEIVAVLAVPGGRLGGTGDIAVVFALV